MCKRGNDIVRRYLWLAALNAARFNPATKPLYQRLRAKHPDHPSIAIGHVMRKLLHLALAVWKTGKSFDPHHYPWDRAAHLPGAPMAAPVAASASTQPSNTQAAGHNQPVEPERLVVTAACVASSVTEAATVRNASATATPVIDSAMSQLLWVNFEHIKAQLPLARVLDQLRLRDSLRGRGAQLKGPCPLHGPSSADAKRGCTFSVNLQQNVFHCFHPSCARKGDVIDLWAALHGLNLRQAAIELVHRFNLEPAPGTEKRNYERAA